MQHVLPATRNGVDAAQDHQKVPSHPLQILQVPRIHREDKLSMRDQVAPLPGPPDRSTDPLIEKGKVEDEGGTERESQKDRCNKELTKVGTDLGEYWEQGRERSSQEKEEKVEHADTPCD